MKSIYKILIAFLAICMLVTGVNANVIEWQSFNIASQDGEYGIIEFTPNSGETGITIDGNGNTISTGDHCQGALKAWQYEDIEIT